MTRPTRKELVALLRDVTALAATATDKQVRRSPLLERAKQAIFKETGEWI